MTQAVPIGWLGDLVERETESLTILTTLERQQRVSEDQHGIWQTEVTEVILLKYFSSLEQNRLFV